MTQNKTPVSGYTGVYYSNDKQCYYIDLGGLTYFTNISKAAQEHDRRALIYFHDCAILNDDTLLDYKQLQAA